MKKIIALSLAAIMTAAIFTGCNNTPANEGNSSTPSTVSAPQEGTPEDPAGNDGFDSSNMISVISREDGSGTRGAFIELVGVEVKGDDGTKTDMTTVEATILNNTEAVITGVAGNPYAIGYISLGSLNDTVKALQIDGVTPSTETVKDGSYKIARPFNIATKGEATGLAKDFIDFILSKEGQEVVSKSCITINDAPEAYAGDKPEGKLSVAGSSSVSPIMEKLIEAYKAVNPNATVELQSTDSSAGMQAAIDGTCDIGMASRELKDSEKEQLTATQIALDGIAVIVNTANTTESLTAEQVKNIYTGEITTWADAVK